MGIFSPVHLLDYSSQTGARKIKWSKTALNFPNSSPKLCEIGEGLCIKRSFHGHNRSLPQSQNTVIKNRSCLLQLTTNSFRKDFMCKSTQPLGLIVNNMVAVANSMQFNRFFLTDCQHLVKIDEQWKSLLTKQMLLNSTECWGIFMGPYHSTCRVLNFSLPTVGC